MSKSYHVKSVRITRPWFGTKCFYVPMRYDRIDEKHWSLKDSDEMDTVWGYETEASAWKVIDEQIYQDDIAELEASNTGSYSDPDREDFHADG